MLKKSYFKALKKLNIYAKIYTDDRIKVKAVTYSSYEWLDFEELWNTGYENRGAMVLIG